MNHPAHRASVERYVTQSRLGPYLTETGNDYVLAEELYVWNLRVSGAFHEVLGVFEVVLRNALCEQLRHWHGKRTGTWLDDPTSKLDDRRIEQIKEARQALSQKNKPLTEGRIVAELSTSMARNCSRCATGSHTTNRFIASPWPTYMPQCCWSHLGSTRTCPTGSQT